MTELRLDLEKLNSKTVISHRYFTSPLKLGTPNSYEDRLHVVLMMASAGILKGDEFDYRINAGRDTKCKIYEQSYGKVFDMGPEPDDGKASKHLTIKVEDNASLVYRPSPIIPFNNSCYSSSSKIYLSGNSEFIWCDMLTAGRVDMGEKFRFRRLTNDVRVYVDGRLSWMDFADYEPAKFDVTNLVYWREFTRTGTLYFYSSDEKCQHLLDRALEISAGNEKLMCGVSQASKGVVVRVLANQSQDIEELFDELISSLGDSL